MLRRPHRRADPAAFPPAAEGVVLGRRLAGERVLPIGAEGHLVWPFSHIPRHAVVLGASGSGKTETSMRVAHQVASKSSAAVFYLDAKGDRAAAERFVALMKDAGRRPRVFPNEPFDAWRGDWRGIVNRLLEVIEFTKQGPAAYYRDIAKTVLQLVCNHPEGPPRSSRELLDRIDYDHLLDAHGSNPTIYSLRDKVGQVRLRYEAFFGQAGCSLDGDWSWEDTDCAYLMLDSVGLGEDAGGAACLLFADYAHYFSKRKPLERPCVLIVDEFAAIAEASDIAMKVEQARGFNAGIVLVPQTPAGLGPELQRDRVLGSVETVILHAVNEPDEVTALAGSREVLELSHRYGDGVEELEGFARHARRPKIDPDRVRELEVGSAWLIRRGRAAKVAIDRAPDVAGEALPPAVPLDRPVERVEAEPPKELSYLDDLDGG